MLGPKRLPQRAVGAKESNRLQNPRKQTYIHQARDMYLFAFLVTVSSLNFKHTSQDVFSFGCVLLCI